MPTTIAGGVNRRYVEFTATELGFTTSLVGAGTVVELVDYIPEGWSVKEINVKRLGTITNGSGTTVLSVGTDGDSGTNNVVTATDIEGSGAGWVATQTNLTRYDSTAPIALEALITTATAAASAVAGLGFEIILAKIGRET